MNTDIYKESSNIYNSNKFSKNYVVLTTIKYIKWNFNKESISWSYIEPTSVPKDIDKDIFGNNVRPSEIFKAIMKLGESIYNSLDKLDTLNNLVAYSVANELNHKKGLFISKDEILNIPNINGKLKNIFDTYGLSGEWLNNDTNELDAFKLINLSLSIYIIYLIRNIMINVKRHKAYELINKIDYLRDIFKIEGIDLTAQKDFKYNKIVAKRLRELISWCISITNSYIKLCFNNSNNGYKLVLNDNISYFTETDDKDRYEIDFYKLIYFVDDYFLYAYEYLLRILPLRNDIPPLYLCDNCGAIMDQKNCLCIDCKIQLGNEIINHPTQKNKNKIEEIENNLKELKERQIDTMFTIEDIYIDRRNHKKSYNKKKKSNT